MISIMYLYVIKYTYILYLIQKRKSCVKEEISEGKLRAVSCLKGGLVEEMEDQNSLILEQSGTVASLNIQLEEMAIKNQHLEAKNR